MVKRAPANSYYRISSKDLLELLHTISAIPLAVIEIQGVVPEKDRASVFAPFVGIVGTLSDIANHIMGLASQEPLDLDADCVARLICERDEAIANLQLYKSQDSIELPCRCMCPGRGKSFVCADSYGMEDGECGCKCHD
jgi:hypothetical protein